MSEKITSPLVGAHFRPPAKAVLRSLPAGTRLRLEPEPDNPYDAKAIRVLVDLAGQLPFGCYDLLESCLEGTGFTRQDLLAPGQEPLHLGYVADSDGRASGGGPGNREIGQLIYKATEAGLRPMDEVLEASLQFSPEGNPLVCVWTLA